MRAALRTRTESRGGTVDNNGRPPDATVYRLSLYHCYLADAQRRGDTSTYLTSRALAEELDLSEETVRRDLTYIDSKGRPGTGYVCSDLFAALEEFLGLREEYPIVRIGTAQTLATLQALFPEDYYGITQAAYFSELEEEAGASVGDVEVRHVSEIPALDPALGVNVALVACSQPWIEPVLEMLNDAGVSGVLLLTPKLKLERPPGMNVRHIRMPCDIKSLACGCRFPTDR